MNKDTVKKAVIAGATGLVGSHLLKQLLNDPRYQEIHVPGRRAPELTDPRIIFHACDFETFESLPSQGINEVYCALGTTIKKAGSQDKFREIDFDAVINLARWAAGIKCSHFVVVSSMGANPRAGNFYLRTKGQMEQVLKTCGLENLTIIRPSLLLGHRHEFRPGEKLSEWIMRPLRYVMVGPLKKYRPIKAQQVAKAMMNLAQINIGDIFIVENNDLT
jgi:uncharacterized protein YbjT (DUF2867 family)